MVGGVAVTRAEWLAALAVRWEVADDGTVTPWEPDVPALRAALAAAEAAESKSARLRESGRRAALLRDEAAHRGLTDVEMLQTTWPPMAAARRGGLPVRCKWIGHGWHVYPERAPGSVRGGPPLECRVLNGRRWRTLDEARADGVAWVAEWRLAQEGSEG